MLPLRAVTFDVFSLPFTEINQPSNLPNHSGLYFVISNKQLLYVGKSINLHNRWKQHEKHKEFCQFHNCKISWMRRHPEDIDEYEKELIKKLVPPLNKTFNGIAEKVRIKAKYAQFIRSVAEEREETFLDALYYLLDCQRQIIKGNQVLSPSLPTPQLPPPAQPQPNQEVQLDEDIDISDFE